jgi:hypothetical protein
MARVKINSTINNQPDRNGLIQKIKGLTTRKAMISCLYHLGDWPRKLEIKAVLSVDVIVDYYC